ncbi:hypothetical protein [Bradyrhizobium sp. OAE829]|uniref:hypothetical protein n=1 Tax=Bradyrhizobium sp. OAE829 TaxID=2663807 RepID=UPI00178970C4
MTVPRTRPLADFLRIFVAPVVWFIHLVLLYGAEALLCIPPAGSARATIWVGISATVAALAALVLVSVSAPRVDARSKQTGATFLRNTALSLALLSAVGIIWNTLPLALVRACALATP